ncbi:MAG: hypothetical protein ACJ8DJ_21860, partial [Gemmatimonadales bacterium]
GGDGGNGGDGGDDGTNASGGAIFWLKGNLSLLDTAFTKNSAKTGGEVASGGSGGKGGTGHDSGGANGTPGSSGSGDGTARGGAVCVSSATRVTLSRDHFTSNTAERIPGGGGPDPKKR